MVRRGPSYWFPTKRYGWGWGLPICWQGWVVMIAYFILLLLGAITFPPMTKVFEFVIYVQVLTLVLVLICWLKGEPPRWRWGD
ncbi:MAG: hypothetical protein FJ160_05540 [Gammaproteobacteria bacterium]|nr:hypothetical protein [Gammaproteobacteria bacterium]